MTDEELDLVPTDDLMDALRRRTKAYAIGLLWEVDNHSDGDNFWWHGGVHLAAGLARALTLALDGKLLNGLPSHGERA